MSVYVMSDLHGMELSELKGFLSEVSFNDSDFLYILGDVIDRRGDGGVGVLRWLMTTPNVEFILGNHEEMLLKCDFLFGEKTSLPMALTNKKNLTAYNTYLESGGEVTLDTLKKLDTKTVNDIFDYLRKAPLYKTLTVNGRDFILCHGGLDEFDKSKNISDYTSDEILWAWPEYEDEYYEDITTVFGHTPTLFYGKEFKGKILHRPTWIDIDIGSVYGNGTAMLRLDDMKEFYR